MPRGVYALFTSTSVQDTSLLGEMPVPQTDPVRVLAVADTDSYLKWSLATLTRWPATWRKTQVVIDNPVRPSATQIGSARGTGVTVLRRARLLRRIQAEQPDVVLLACSGPVTADLTRASFLRGADRPVVVTGMPGISIPASRRAVALRADCDLFLVHSHREVAAYREVTAGLSPTAGVMPEFGLASLPFLEPAEHRETRAAPTGGVVFAGQALVPPQREQREQILVALAGLAATGTSVVVKLRAAAREQQTHRERWPYPELMTDLAVTGRIRPGAVSFRGGPMSDALHGAIGLVTVSSTAALEAVAAGVPIMIISDFGVDGGMINTVFSDSGCLGTLADLRDGRFAHPRADWLGENYLHPSVDNDDLSRLRLLITRRRAGELAIRSRAGVKGWPGLRRRLRLLLPRPGRAAARWAQRWVATAHGGRDRRVPARHPDPRLD